MMGLMRSIGGQIAVIAMMAAAAAGWLWKHDRGVIEKDRARVTEANKNAATKGARAAAKSTAGGVQAGAKRDPLTRD